VWRRSAIFLPSLPNRQPVGVLRYSYWGLDGGWTLGGWLAVPAKGTFVAFANKYM